jgi:hypothetical protein
VHPEGPSRKKIQSDTLRTLEAVGIGSASPPTLASLALRVLTNGLRGHFASVPEGDENSISSCNWGAGRYAGIMKLDSAIPPESLLEELQEVATYSSSLIAAIKSANGIPKAFPREAVFDLCVGLGGLQFGTAEGCRVPLEYARSRLPAIRRQFIFREEDRVHDELTGDEPPPLMRGMTIDLAFQSLIAAITTALDEYRRLASAQFAESISVDQEFDSTAISKAEVIGESVSVGKFISEHEALLSGAVKNDSEAGAGLIRSLKDADNVNKLARSEVKQTLVVVRWLQRLSRQMVSLPDAFRAMAGFVKVSADVVQPLRKLWTQTVSDVEDFLFDRYRKLGEAFSEIADNIEKKRPKDSAAKGARSIEPNINDGFEHWALCFVSERSGAKQGIDASLFYPEVKHLTGMTSSEFAKRRGYASFKDLLKSLPLLKLLPKGASYEVRAVEGKDRQKLLRTRRDNFVWVFAQIILILHKQKMVDHGTNIVSLKEVIRYPWLGSGDNWASFVKITNEGLAEIFQSYPGIKFIPNDTGGMFEIENPEALIKAIFPERIRAHLEKNFL